MIEIEYLPTASLNAAPYNPRKMPDEQMARLMRGIEAFGLVDPVIVNQATGNIVGGHQRVEAAKRLKLAQVPVVHVSLDRDQEKALNLALNKISGEWDLDLLRGILGDLSADDFDLDLTGFSAGEVAELLAGGLAGDDPEREPGDPDEVPEVDEQAPPVTKPGDLIILGRHRLLCGDSTKAEDVARLMDGALADMVFTDPPYGIAIVQGHKVGGDKPFGSADRRDTAAAPKIIKANTYAEVIGDDSVETAIASYRVSAALFPKAALIFWGGNHYAEHLPSSSCWVVWDKENTGNFADAELAWTNQKTAVRLVRHQWNGMIKASERGEKRVHPTQKPVALAEWCFNQYGKAGDKVIDLFGGSGSTLIACEQTARDCYMVEMSPAYCDVIVARWEKFTGKTAQRPERETASGKPRQGRKAAV